MLPLYLPYFEQPSWPIPFPVLGEVTIHGFGVLVALALIVGTWVSRWHGTSRGLDPTHVVDGATWTCIAGFVTAHIVSVVFYFPDRLREDPLQILYIWNGLSSFGGFLGAAVGSYLYFKHRGLSPRAYIDALAVGLGPGWVLGRLGCTIAHDHPGVHTDFALGFGLPPTEGTLRDVLLWIGFDEPRREMLARLREGPIHDLGLYECAFAVCVTLVVLFIRRLRWPPGVIPAVMCLMYAPVRFSLDYLRIADATYDGLTPGQWMAIGMAVGGYLLIRDSFGTLRWQELAVPGVLSVVYGAFRLIRGFSTPDGEVGAIGLSDGQWLALIICAIGLWLARAAWKWRKSHGPQPA